MAESTLYWNRLTEILERFISAWEIENDPPDIGAFLPEEIDPVWRLIASELIKADMEYRFKRGCFELLDWYVTRFPEIAVDDVLPFDLVHEELHYLRLREREISGDELRNRADPVLEYLERYPQYSGALKRLFLGTECTYSTAIAKAIPKKIFNPGDVIDDFQLVQRLGEGAFGQVFLAKQVSMQRLVALKITTMRSNEPETLAQLEHPSIVRVYDQRRDGQHDVWLLYMQFAPGGTLKEVVDLVKKTPAEERSGKLLLSAVDDSLERVGYSKIESISLKQKLNQSEWAAVVCRIGIQLALALDFAHNKGVLHRDIKPANVLLSGECLPKLADFNISYASSLEGSDATAFFGGSLAYMSPEQLEAFNPELDADASLLDARADLYSLCAMLWELLTGKRPFLESDLTVDKNRLLRQLTLGRRQLPPLPDELRTRISKDLAKVLLMGLDPERENRPVSGKALAISLWYCLEPKAKRLMIIPTASWRELVLAHPLLICALVILVPNGFAGWFNYVYNQGHIIEMGEDAHRAFQLVSIVLNIIYFSGGFLLAVFILGPVTRHVRMIWLEKKVLKKSIYRESSNIEYPLRNKCLQLGRIATAVGIILWLSSGLIFPLGISLLTGSFVVDMYLHFFASMTVCGLIAAAYPFFGITYLATRVMYPILLDANSGTEDDKNELIRLEQSLSMPLFAAAFVPLTSTLLVVLLDYQNKLVAMTLILAGLQGLLLVYYLHQKIRINIATLLRLLNPLDGISTEGQNPS